MSDDSTPRDLANGQQLDLLGEDEEGRAKDGSRSSAIAPASVPSDVAELASEIGPHTRYGTSTWSYPGWANLVYDAGAAHQRPTTIAKQGLPSYCAHPLFDAVGLDRTHYGPLKRDAYAKMASQTPPNFRFVVKAHEASTIQKWPLHARYGQKRGEKNPLYLDAEYAAEVIEEMKQGFGAMQDTGDAASRLGLVLFQFAPQDVQALGGPNGFARRLDGFLARLPGQVRYAVEVRNEELISDALAEVLLTNDAVGCITVLPQLPSPLAQVHQLRAGEGPEVLVRWMVPRDTTYEEAKERFQPYSKMKEPAPKMRAEIALVVLACERSELPCTVIVNNLAEGSAPRSVSALLGEVRRLRKRLNEQDLEDS